MTDFRALGGVIRDHVDVRLPMEKRLAGRKALVQKVTAPRADAPRRFQVLVFAASVSVLGAFAVWSAHTPVPEQLSFSASAAGSGQIGAAYGGRTSQVPLRFSDGSLVQLEPGATAYVSQTTARGATIQIVSGRVRVEVVPRSESEWLVVAGPFTVKVTGTAFTLEWSAKAGRLDMQMLHGSVLINGPTLNTGVRLAGQQRLSVVDRAPRDAAESGQTPRPAEERPAPGPRAELETDARSKAPVTGLRSPARAVQSAESEENRRAPDLVHLVRSGDYAGVLRAAEVRGLDGILSGGTLEEVSAVADSARYVGRTDLAIRALRAMRSRFAGSGRATSAAFLLGRLSEQLGDGAAVDWYETYLSESPAGTFAAEASGRRMLWLYRTGATGRAEIAARDYLSRHPSGTYAKHARDLVAHTGDRDAE